MLRSRTEERTPEEDDTMTKREHRESECGLDANIYATRKTVAQGLLDIALLTANAGQLKSVLAAGDQHQHYLVALALIAASMALQVIVGILLVMVGRCNINKRKDQRSANSANNAIVILIFLITVINVLVTAFSDEGDDSWRDRDLYREPSQTSS